MTYTNITNTIMEEMRGCIETAIKKEMQNVIAFFAEKTSSSETDIKDLLKEYGKSYTPKTAYNGRDKVMDKHITNEKKSIDEIISQGGLYIVTDYTKDSVGIFGATATHADSF